MTGSRLLRVVTDESWKTHPSPNTTLGVWDFTHFGGELYDATREVPVIIHTREELRCPNLILLGCSMAFTTV